MEDPDYADKYCDGADKTDLPGKLKQAADARFLEGASGKFVSGGLAYRPDSGGLAQVSVGAEHYYQSYLTGHAALTGIASDDYFVGADLGWRIQSPSRFAPFVGVGTFAGYSKESVDATDDNRDNDDDGLIDEWNEQDDRFDGFIAAVYPETGAHFWWNPSCRFTTYGRYLITTQGRRADDWLIGCGIAWFSK